MIAAVIANPGQTRSADANAFLEEYSIQASSPVEPLMLAALERQHCPAFNHVEQKERG